MIEKIKEMATSAFDEIVEIRRHLHQHPELSFHEYKTSAYIKSILTSRGYEIWAGGGKNPDYQPNDPFNNLIIVRNPVTKEFIILLIKIEINFACIIAGGQSIETIENMDLDIEL